MEQPEGTSGSHVFQTKLPLKQLQHTAEPLSYGTVSWNASKVQTDGRRASPTNKSQHKHFRHEAVLYLFLYHFLERINGTDGRHVLRRRRVSDPAPPLGSAAAAAALPRPPFLHKLNPGEHLEYRTKEDTM